MARKTTMRRTRLRTGWKARARRRERYDDRGIDAEKKRRRKRPHHLPHGKCRKESAKFVPIALSPTTHTFNIGDVDDIVKTW